MTIGGIDCVIALGPDGLSEGLSEEWPADGPRGDVHFKCLWEDRYDLAQALMGSTSIIGGVVVRVPPYAYPESPNLSVQALGRIQGIGPRVLQVATGLAPAGWLAFDYAVIPAFFGTPRFAFDGSSTGIGIDGGGAGDIADPSGQAYTTTTFHVSGEHFTPPTGSYFYQDGSTAWVPVHDSLIGLIRPQVEISIVRHMVPFIDLAAIVPFIGKVNLNTVTFANHAFAAGMLLFAGFKGSRKVDTMGTVTFEVEYGLLGRTDYSWNHLMGQDAAYHLLSSTSNGTGPPPFLQLDFAGVP